MTDLTTLLKLIDDGIDLVPLRKKAKEPLHKKWTTRNYSKKALQDWANSGGNFGVRIGKNERILDVDHQRDPHGRSADQIIDDLEMAFGCDLSNTRRVRTGSDGLHVYLTANGELHRERLPGPEWAAIELKSHGRQCVAPGSLHPSGNLYRLENAALPAPLPAALSAALVRERTESKPAEISLGHLKRLLDQLDPCDYTDGRDGWLQVLMEVHSASGGSLEAFDVFCDWSARDEAWPSDPDNWLAQWERLHGDRTGDRTVASLFQRVIEAGGNPTAPAAEDFDELPPLETEVSSRTPVLLAPFDEASLPRFPWLVDGLLAHGTLTTTIAKGGTGKSLLTLHMVRMVAAGVTWALWETIRPAKSLLVTAEDDVTEQRRRFAAVCKQMDLPVAETAGMIAIETAEPLLIRAVGASTPRRTAFWNYLVETIKRDGYEVVIFDPLMSFGRGLDENSNDDRHLMATTLRELAAATGACVHAVQHAVKGNKYDQDAGRGGSAFVDASRAALILNEMTEDEAELLLSESEREERWRYVKVTLAKANYSRKFGGQKWFRKCSLEIANGEERPALEPWSPTMSVPELNEETVALLLTVVATASAASKPHTTTSFADAIKNELKCSDAEAQAHVANLVTGERVRTERVVDPKNRRVKIELHLPHETITPAENEEWMK